MYSWFKKLLEDSVVYGLTPVLSKAMSFLLLPVYTRYLSPSEYGILAILLAISIISSTICSHGMASGVFKFHSYKRIDTSLNPVNLPSLYKSTAVIATLLVSLIVLLILVFYRQTLSLQFFDGTDIVNEFTAILLYSFLSCNLSVHFAIFRAKREKKRVVTLNFVRMIVSILVTLLMLIYYGQGLYGYIIGLVSGELIVLIILSPVISKLFREGFNLKKYFELVKYSISFVPHRLMGIVMMYVGIYFINIHAGTNELGLYSIAEKITLPMMIIIGSVQQAWATIKFEIIAAEKKPFEVISKILSGYILILIVLYVLVSLWGGFLLPILVSDVFREASYYIPFLALIHISNAVYFIYASAIEVGKSTYLLPLSSLSGLVTTTFLSYKFIPIYGPAAAALALSFGWITMALVVNLISKRQIKIKLKYLVVLFSTLVLILVFKYVSPHDVYLSIIGTLIFLLLFIVFFRRDIVYLLRLLNEKNT